jgi:hypothetical protein
VWPRPAAADAIEPDALADVTGGGKADEDRDEDVDARADLALDPLALRFPGTPPEVITPAWLRLQARQILREFLAAVPRAEAATTLAFLRPDGTPRTLTRAQLSVAIDLLRPRQRQIVRLVVEERWSHRQVCDYLHHISPRTLERDLAEALDVLAQL